MSDKQQCEHAIALAWFEGKYTQDQAQLSAELQGVDFNRVKNEYGNIYAECEQEANCYG